MVAELKATQRAAKAEVTRRAGLRLQLELAAMNEKLKAKAGDSGTAVATSGKGVVAKDGGGGFALGGGPVKKGLWGRSSKSVVVATKE